MRPSIFILAAPFLLLSCSKKSDAPVATVNDFTVTNGWQFEIDGKQYSGSVDTSFYTISPASFYDSTVFVSGSSSDGKANIALRIFIDRTHTSGNSSQIYLQNSFISYDTLSDDNTMTPSFTAMNFSVEGFTLQKLKGTFSGQIRAADGSLHNVLNGSISFDVGRSGTLAQTAAFQLQNPYIEQPYVFGPVRSAVFNANTLIVDGISFQTPSTYQIQIRTGASVKTGTYKSTVGEVGFQIYQPSIVTHYVSDSLGDISVTITSVNGNIVTGTYSGHVIREDGIFAAATLTNGRFKCRVKNYTPGIDSLNQWHFNVDNRGQFPFFTAGGNITKASVSQSIYGYTLSMNGKSDNGNSFFHLNVTSNNPLVPGTYPLSVFSIDSCYFTRPSVKFYNYYNTNNNFYVRIDAINGQEVTGGFFGSFLQGAQLYGSGWLLECRKGYFKAQF